MKILPTPTSLSLVLHSIDHIILPQVTTKALRDQIGYIRLAVNDLLKRHGPLAQVLHDLLDEGLALERSVLEFLDGNASCHQEPIPKNDFERLWAYHASLTARLQQLSIRLSKEQPNTHTSDSMLWRIGAWETKYYTQLATVQPEPFGNAVTNTPQDTLPLSKDEVEKLLVEARGPLIVESLERNPGGFSKQTYFVTLRYEDDSMDHLVIRLADAAPLLDINTFDLAREYDLLIELCRLNFPCPTPVELIHHPLSKKPYFFVMKRLPGSMIGNFVDSGSLNVGENIWLKLAELLARLHSISIDSIGDYIEKYEGADCLTMTTGDYYRKQLNIWSTYLNSKPHLESPIIIWALHWLNKNVPDDSRPLVLIHGDFNIHNILAAGGEITGVVDWETSMLGSVEHDLAYIKPHVSQHIAWDRFIDHYVASGGRKVRTEDMPFYLAFAWMQLTIGANQLHAAIYEGRNRDIRFIMCEQAFTSIFMGTILESTNPESLSAGALLSS